MRVTIAIVDLRTEIGGKVKENPPWRGEKITVAEIKEEILPQEKVPIRWIRVKIIPLIQTLRSIQTASQVSTQTVKRCPRIILF